MCYVCGERISVVVLISFLSAFYAMVSFDGRFRLGLHTFCKMSLTGRHARYTITTRVEVSHRRRIAWVGKVACISIRQVCHLRRSIRFLCNVKRRRDLGIITVFRATTSANYGNVCVLRRQAMFGTNGIVASENLSR